MRTERMRLGGRSRPWWAILVTLAGCGSAATETSPPGADDAGADATKDAPSSGQLVDQLAGKRVLWIGAHPDDETTVAPLLGEACRERGARCSFLVVTRGEAGGCGVPAGCAPDIATFRVGEMKTAAALYGGDFVQWDLPDGSAPTPDRVAQAWAERRGGTDALVDSFRAAIVAAAPDVIVTFDPRHGTTCHPDHRAASGLAVLALRKLGAVAPPAWLSEVRLDIAAGETTIGYTPAVSADAAMLAYDATRMLPSFGDTAWSFLLANLRAHASQFSASRVAAFGAASDAERRVYLLPLAAAVDTDARYSICP